MAPSFVCSLFVASFQQRKNKQLLFSVYTNGMPNLEPTFNAKAEIAVILMAIAAFVLFWFQPEFPSILFLFGSKTVF
ncbi:MAG: hypothetical protein R2779_07425 [Crocinitomicaceae bacterium]